MSKLNILNRKKVNYDHRELNQDLEIFFSTDKIGQGLPILLKNGTIIKNLIQQFIRSKEKEFGFEEVISPVLADPSLYEKSGHLAHYDDYIFPLITKDSEKFQLRPMTCPHHCVIFSRKVNSYKQLPVWLSEHSILHRFESSGSLKGLERARWMEISDNHVFAREDQLNEVFKKVFLYIKEILQKFETRISRFVCSLHDIDNRNKYHTDEQLWNKVEGSLVDSLNNLQIDFVSLKGEAAFYGPKLDIEVEAADGKNITVATIQFDFVLPKKFNLVYIDKEGKQVSPVIIHFSSIGSYQRFISIILEQTQGRLPLWLAPYQLVILPLFTKEDKEQVLSYCEKVTEQLNKERIRFEVWTEKRLASRIKKVHKLKVPCHVVIGEKEVKSNYLNLEFQYTNIQVTTHFDDLLKTLWTAGSASES